MPSLTLQRRHPNPFSARGARVLRPTTPQPVLATIARPDFLDHQNDIPLETLPPVQGQPMCDHMGWLRVRRGAFPLWRKRWVAVQGPCILVFASGSGPDGRAESYDVPQIVIDLRDEVQLRVDGRVINVGENQHLNFPKTTRFSLTGESLPNLNWEIQFETQDVDDLGRWCLAIRRAANGRCQRCLVLAAFSPRHKMCFGCIRDNLVMGWSYQTSASIDTRQSSAQGTSQPASWTGLSSRQSRILPSASSSSSSDSVNNTTTADWGHAGVFSLRHPPGRCSECHREFELGNLIITFDRCHHVFHCGCLFHGVIHPSHDRPTECPLCD